MVTAMRSSKEAMEAYGKGKTEWFFETGRLLGQGIYEVPAGDYLVPALAHCMKENVLVFDLNLGMVHACSASVWGGEIVDLPPFLFVYDGSHYEVLLPKTEADAKLTKDYLDEQVKKDKGKSHNIKEAEAEKAAARNEAEKVSDENAEEAVADSVTVGAKREQQQQVFFFSKMKP